MGVAFTRQRRMVLVVCGVVFAVASGAATRATFRSAGAVWPALALGHGVPALALAAYAVDRVWAPFCLELTYLTALCWVCWPLLVAADAVALLL